MTLLCQTHLCQQNIFHGLMCFLCMYFLRYCPQTHRFALCSANVQILLIGTMNLLRLNFTNSIYMSNNTHLTNAPNSNSTTCRHVCMYVCVAHQLQNICFLSNGPFGVNVSLIINLLNDICNDLQFVQRSRKFCFH